MTENKKPIPFDSLPAYEKPMNCDIRLMHPGLDIKGNRKAVLAIGYRFGDPTIYFQDGISAGSYHLPEPLESMGFKRLNEIFPVEDKLVIPKRDVRQIWNAAHLLESKNPSKSNLQAQFQSY